MEPQWIPMDYLKLSIVISVAPSDKSTPEILYQKLVYGLSSHINDLKHVMH